jgi:tryptophan 2,3-dioxygenase
MTTPTITPVQRESALSRLRSFFNNRTHVCTLTTENRDYEVLLEYRDKNGSKFRQEHATYVKFLAAVTNAVYHQAYHRINAKGRAIGDEQAENDPLAMFLGQAAEALANAAHYVTVHQDIESKDAN